MTETGCFATRVVRQLSLNSGSKAGTFSTPESRGPQRAYCVSTPLQFSVVFAENQLIFFARIGDDV